MKKLQILLIFFCLTTYLSAFAYQNERIISYHSDIEINVDGSMKVKETIKVYAQGNEIKRGIYRDFPTRYKDNYGNSVIVDMDIQGVFRNGKPEDYHTENLSNGIRIYIGNENVFLEPGEYIYNIVYKTSRQLGFFDNHDELYWNVTGNGWSFTIEQASATVSLPHFILEDKLKHYGYTGISGSRSANLKTKYISAGKVNFTATRPLISNEGLTIVLEFPKGIVDEPSTEAKFAYFMSDNRSEVIAIAALFILFIYYMMVWNKVGKDPAKNTIIPLFNPPDNLSPSAVRYISEMGYDNKIFTAAVINMAVKGYLQIKEDDGKYSLIKTGNGISLLSHEEKKIAEKLRFSSKKSNSKSLRSAVTDLNNFAKNKNFFVRKIIGVLANRIEEKQSAYPNEPDEPINENVLELDNKNHSVFSGAINSLKAELKKSYEKVYFLTNRKQFFIGVGITVLFLVLSFGFSSPEQLFILFWLSFWSVGVGFLVSMVIRSWKQFFSSGKKITFLAGTIFLTLFAVPFVFGELAGLFFFYSVSSPLAALLVGIIIFLNVLFFHLLKAPTLLGRKVLDKIEGFKIYLSTAEKDRLNYSTSLERTPELFEKYLPYALALGVEQKWAEYFSDVLETAGIEKNYSPSWYRGTNWQSFNTASFVSSIGSSFSSAVSSSSTAPGSSSGSSGSSGGGGGGGGGGGW